MTWSYEGEPSDADRRTEASLRKLFENDRVAYGFSRFFSLYRYLRKNPPTNPRVLRTTVFLDKAGILPFFDDHTSKKVCHMWKIIHNPTLFTEYLQKRFKKVKKGGAGIGARQEEVLDRAIDYAVDKAGDAVESAGITPEAPGIKGTVAKVGSWGTWIATLPMRILPWIESNPYIGGPFWKVAIDLFLKLVPKIILAIQTVTPIIALPLMPVFGLGFVVESISFVITTFLGLTTMFLSLALGKVGSAFLAFLGLVPFIGSFLRLGVTNILGLYTDIEDELPTIGKLPIVGPLVYKEPVPVEQQENVGPQPAPEATGGEQRPERGGGRTRRQRRRRGTYKKSA
jgi:hypothetical protein